MGQVLRECGDPVLGALVIDWKARTATYHGMTGNGPADDLTKAEVDELLARHRDDPDVRVQPLIFWKDQDQLAVHDAGSWSQAWVEEDDEPT